MVLDREDIKHLPYHMVHEAPDIAGSVVEPGRRREDNSSRLGEGEHVAEVNPREWRLPGDKDQGSALLESTICCTEEEVVGKPARNPCHRLHAAGDNDHPAVREPT